MRQARFNRRIPCEKHDSFESMQLQPLLPSESSLPKENHHTSMEYDRFSTVAMEMLREREDRDLHPYGRGGRFEGFLYDSRRVKVSLDHSKMLAWVSIALLLILLTGAIIYLAESERKRNLTLATSTVKPDDTTLTSPVG